MSNSRVMKLQRIRTISEVWISYKTIFRLIFSETFWNLTSNRFVIVYYLSFFVFLLSSLHWSKRGDVYRFLQSVLTEQPPSLRAAFTSVLFSSYSHSNVWVALNIVFCLTSNVFLFWNRYRQDVEPRIFEQSMLQYVPHIKRPDFTIVYWSSNILWFFLNYTIFYCYATLIAGIFFKLGFLAHFKNLLLWPMFACVFDVLMPLIIDNSLLVMLLFAPVRFYLLEFRSFKKFTTWLGMPVDWDFGPKFFVTAWFVFCVFCSIAIIRLTKETQKEY